jgi:hypothetical protein
MQTAGPAALLLENIALDAALSGGTWQLGLDYLKEPTIKETQAVCAAGTPDQAWFDVSFPVDTRWDTLFLAGGTLSRTATYRLSWYDAAGTLLAGGPAAPFTRVYPPGLPRAARNWRRGNFWSGAPGPRELAGKPRGLIARPGVSLLHRRLRVEIDNGGAPLALGHLFIAPSLRPAWPHDWGLTLGAKPLSIVETTPGGMRISDVRPHPRTKSFDLKELSEVEAMMLHDAGMGLAHVGPLAMIEDVRRAGNWWRRTWLANLEEGVVNVREVGPDRWEATGVKLLEIVA